MMDWSAFSLSIQLALGTLLVLLPLGLLAGRWLARTAFKGRTWIEAAMARLVWRVPTSSEGRPRKGASRTPALELPTMQAAFFISSEKCAKRMEGRMRKRS